MKSQRKNYWKGLDLLWTGALENLRQTFSSHRAKAQGLACFRLKPSKQGAKMNFKFLSLRHFVAATRKVSEIESKEKHNPSATDSAIWFPDSPAPSERLAVEGTQCYTSL